MYIKHFLKLCNSHLFYRDFTLLCNFHRFDFTCIFFLEILLFFLCYTVRYVLLLKGNVTSLFLILSSLKKCNLHQFSEKIISENATYVLLSLAILYVSPIKIFKKLILKMKSALKNPILSKKYFFENFSLSLFVLKQQCINRVVKNDIKKRISYALR